MRSESGLSGRAARRASPGWAVSPHERPLISDAGRAARPSRARHDRYADLGADRGGTRGPPGEPIRTNRKGPAMTLQPPGGRRRRRWRLPRPCRRAEPPGLAQALARLEALLPPEAAGMLAHADVLTCSDGRIFVYSPWRSSAWRFLSGTRVRTAGTGGRMAVAGPGWCGTRAVGQRPAAGASARDTSCERSGVPACMPPGAGDCLSDVRG